MRSRAARLLVLLAFLTAGAPVLAACGDAEDRPEAQDVEQGVEDAVQEGGEAVEQGGEALQEGAEGGEGQ